MMEKRRISGVFAGISHQNVLPKGRGEDEAQIALDDGSQLIQAGLQGRGNNCWEFEATKKT